MRPPPSDALTPKAWIQEGLEALARFGEPGVKVDVIARRLNISRGSFYWHFKDRADYLDAIVEDWLRITTIVHDYLARQALPPARLLGLALLFGTLPSSPLVPGGPLERALDQWAAYNPKAAEMLRNNHRLRLQYVERLFARMGEAEPEALAAAFYSYMIGHNQMRDHLEVDRAKLAEAAFNLFGVSIPWDRYERMSDELRTVLAEEVLGAA